MNTLRITGIAVVLLTGCASSLPPELVTARNAYTHANQGATVELNPAGLHSAKESLDIAEHSFTEDGDSQETRDLAYSAERKSQVAEAHARELQYTQQKDATVTAMHASQSAQVQATSDELSRTKTMLGAQGQQLQDERGRREDAERRAAAATAALAAIGNVKHDDRGTVITLSGSVLFASNKSVLLASAQSKLAEVADALTKQDPESKLVVEGHADSQGVAADNQELSQRRAEAVRTYLITRGIAPDRITAQGFGMTRPVADNTSPEGRANNRRVEIVVQPSAGKRAGL